MNYEKNLKKIIAEYGSNSDAVVLNKNVGIPLVELKTLESFGLIRLKTLDLSGNIRIRLTADGWSYFETKKIDRHKTVVDFFTRWLPGTIFGSALTLFVQWLIGLILP